MKFTAVGDGVACGKTPVPVRLSVAAGVPPWKVTVSVVVSAPKAEGLNVAVTVHVFPGPGAAASTRLATHVPPVTAKSATLPPDSATAFAVASVTDPLPLFVKVIVNGPLVTPTRWLLNGTGDGVSAIVAVVPAPVRETVCVVPATPPESSVIVSVAVSAAVVAGANVTLTMHVPPLGATAAPLMHVVPVATLKSAAFVPLIATAFAAARFSVSLPLLVSVAVSAALVTPFG